MRTVASDLIGRRLQSKRSLAFFIGFHSAFYAGKRRLCFPKAKLDILCKDHEHKHTDADFAVDLDISDSHMVPIMVLIISKMCCCNLSPLAICFCERLATYRIFSSGSRRYAAGVPISQTRIASRNQVSLLQLCQE